MLALAGGHHPAMGGGRDAGCSPDGVDGVEMKPGKRRDIRGTFGNGRGVYLSDEMRSSAAYRALSPSEKLILADFIRKHYRVSSGDKNDICKTGFAFTVLDTLEAVDSKTFYRARARIVAAGFFDRRPDLKKLTPASPDAFTPSTRWREYSPDAATARRIESRDGRKTDYIKRGADRKRRFTKNRGGLSDD